MADITNYSQSHPYFYKNMLIDAAETGNLNQVKLTVNSGTAPNIDDNLPILCAAVNGHLPIVKWLAQLKDVHGNRKCKFTDDTILIRAIIANQPTVTEYLLKLTNNKDEYIFNAAKGEDYSSNYCNYYLYLAISNNCLEVLRMLTSLKKDDGSYLLDPGVNYKGMIRKAVEVGSIAIVKHLTQLKSKDGLSFIMELPKSSGDYKLSQTLLYAAKHNHYEIVLHLAHWKNANGRYICDSLGILSEIDIKTKPSFARNIDMIGCLYDLYCSFNEISNQADPSYLYNWRLFDSRSFTEEDVQNIIIFSNFQKIVNCYLIMALIAIQNNKNNLAPATQSVQKASKTQANKQFRNFLASNKVPLDVFALIRAYTLRKTKYMAKAPIEKQPGDDNSKKRHKINCIIS